ARWVTKIFACERSPDTSTAVIVTRPTRGSLTWSRRSSASSRWICSPTRCARCECFFTSVADEEELQRPRHFDDLVDLELVALFDVVEVLERQAALEAALHFAHVVLEALQRVELTVVDHDAVAQKAHARAALDHA